MITHWITYTSVNAFEGHFKALGMLPAVWEALELSRWIRWTVSLASKNLTVSGASWEPGPLRCPRMASDTSHSAWWNQSDHSAPKMPALRKVLKSGSGLSVLPAPQALHCDSFSPSSTSRQFQTWPFLSWNVFPYASLKKSGNAAFCGRQRNQLC